MSNVVDLAAARLVREALKAAQDALWGESPPDTLVTSAYTISLIRKIVLTDEVGLALHRANDPIPVGSLLKTREIVSNKHKTFLELVEQLWPVLDDRELNRALGVPQTSRRTFNHPFYNPSA
jgi:hypothetical protein